MWPGLCTPIRWELHSLAFYDKAAQTVVREARTVRGRHGRAIRAFAKVIEQVTKTPLDDAKVRRSIG